MQKIKRRIAARPETGWFAYCQKTNMVYHVKKPDIFTVDHQLYFSTGKYVHEGRNYATQ